MKAHLVSVLALLAVLSFNCAAESENLSTTPKIIGGTPVVGQKYPWMVSLQKRDYITNRRGIIVDEYYWHFCGGFQINSEWLVTAAHCFYDTGYSQEEVIAVIGELDVLAPTESKRKVIDQIIVHPNYNKYERWDEDIALVHLAEPNVLSEYASLTSMDDYSMLTHGTVLNVMGWGYIDNDFSEPDSLLEATIPFQERDECSDKWGSRFTENMLCAGGDGLTDACPGDSGGPLFSQKDGQIQIVGVVSWGSGECAELGWPSVFTAVPNYVSWIQGFTEGLAINSPNDFGIWPQGFEHTKEISLVHHSEGVAPISINSVILSDRAFSVVVNGCTGRSLNPGESCNLDVKFEAGAYEDESAQIYITSSAGNLEAEVKARAAQTLSLGEFELSSDLVLTTVDSEPFGLSVEGNELKATAWNDNEEIWFFIQAQQAGILTLTVSTKGGEEQYLIMRTEEGYLFDSREGLLEREAVSYSVEQGELLRFSYTGSNINDDERDALTIHAIEFVSDSNTGSGSGGGAAGSTDSPSGSSGGGSIHWLLLAILLGILSCRKKGR